MDGGRRVLRSLGVPFGALSPAAPPLAGHSRVDASPQIFSFPLRRTRRRAAGALSPKLARLLAKPGVGFVCLLALYTGVGLAGAAQSGAYAKFVESEGAPQDILAKALGFGISAVTISGQSDLTEARVLDAAGVTSRQSLAFLDATQVRSRVMALPLVKSARVLKLYPDRLVIAIEERQPFALWQKDGVIHIIDSEGAVVDELRDEKYLTLPFVAGEGAQKRVAEYNALLSLLGDLSTRVKAGVFVSDRRWTLDMKNGVQVKLPEQNAGAAVAELARLQREARILDKDILAIDLRDPGRVAVRLTDEAASARAGAHKPAKSGGHT